MLYVVLYYKDPATLKDRTKWLSTGLEEKGNKRRAAALILEYIEKYRFLENTLAWQSADMPFVDYYKSWLEKKKTDGSIEMSTWEGYKLHSTHIIDYFSSHNIRLCELTPKTVRSHKNLIVNSLIHATIDAWKNCCCAYGRNRQKTGLSSATPTPKRLTSSAERTANPMLRIT